MASQILVDIFNGWGNTRHSLFYLCLWLCQDYLPRRIISNTISNCRLPLGRPSLISRFVQLLRVCYLYIVSNSTCSLSDESRWYNRADCTYQFYLLYKEAFKQTGLIFIQCTLYVCEWIASFPSFKYVYTHMNTIYIIMLGGAAIQD